MTLKFLFFYRKNDIKINIGKYKYECTPVAYLWERICE